MEYTTFNTSKELKVCFEELSSGVSFTWNARLTCIKTEDGMDKHGSKSNAINLITGEYLLFKATDVVENVGKIKLYLEKD